MATLTIGSGQQTVDLGSSGPFYDIYDAETNNSQFLADYLDYVANNRPQSHVSAYPIRFYGANPFIWNGGTIKGNIPATRDWEDWYLSGADDFNSAGLFPRGGARGTINRLVIGERDNLNSYPADGIRVNQAGRITVNNLTVWGCRDDLFESDGNSNTLEINDIYGENLFVFLSATGNIPNATRIVRRALLHFRAWPYQGSNQYGLPLKTGGPSFSPNFIFEDVVFVVGPTTFGDSGTRLTGGLANTTCSGDCRVLVPNGTLQSNTVRNAYLNAGFTIVEGAAAAAEYAARKADWLGETGGNPPPPPDGGYNPDPAPLDFIGVVRTRIICSDGFFVPEQDTELLGWFSAGDASTFVQTEGVVTSWRSKRGNLWELTQLTEASKPRIAERTLNLRAVLDANGANFLAGSVEVPEDGNYAVHFTGIIDGVSNLYQAIIGMNPAWQLEAGNDTQFDGYLRVNGADNFPITGGLYSGLVIGSIIFNKTGNLISVFLNGVLRGSGPYSSVHTPSQSLKVFSNRAQNQFLNGGMMDIIITADITKTNEYYEYLRAKYEGAAPAPAAYSPFTEPTLPSFEPGDYDQSFVGQTFNATGNGQTLLRPDQQGTGQNTLIKGCIFDGNGFSDVNGIDIRNTSNIVVVDCIFRDMLGDGNGVRASSSPGNSTDEVYIIDNDFQNIRGDGISVPQRWYDGVYHTNWYIKGNALDDCGYRSSATHAIYCQGPDHIIVDNEITGRTGGNAISYRSSGLIARNVINIDQTEENNSCGIKYFSDHLTGPTKILLITQNSIQGNGVLRYGIEIKRDEGGIAWGEWVGDEEDYHINEVHIPSSGEGVNTFAGLKTQDIIFTQSGSLPPYQSESWFTYNQDPLTGDPILPPEPPPPPPPPPVVNLLVGGRDLANVAWTHTNTTPTADTWASPLGAGGDTLTSNGTSSETSQNYADWGTGTYNLSCYVNKGGSHRWLRFRMKGISVWFDVIDGVVGTNSGATSAQVIDAGTTWRLEIVGAPGSGGGLIRFNIVNGDNSTTEVNGAAVQLDGVLLTEGATLQAYPV